MAFPELLYGEEEWEGMTARHVLGARFSACQTPMSIFRVRLPSEEGSEYQSPALSACVASSCLLLTHRLHALGQGAACVCRDLQGEQPRNVRTPFLYRPPLGKCRKKLSPATDCSKEGAVMQKILAEAFDCWTLSQHHKPTQPSKRQLLTGHLQPGPDPSVCLSQCSLALCFT